LQSAGGRLRAIGFVFDEDKIDAATYELVDGGIARLRNKLRPDQLITRSPRRATPLLPAVVTRFVQPAREYLRKASG
jgi:hypothetical protein